MRLAFLAVLLSVSGCECCSTDAQCQDGVACNGLEWCNGGFCVPGEPVLCDDGIDCTTDTCREPDGSCSFAPDDSACDDGAFCTGAETCDPASGCVAGTPPTCDDGVGCTSDRCDRRTDACVNTPHDGECDDDVF